MSISEDKTRIQGAKTDLASWLDSKGVTIPTGAKLDDLVGLLGNVPSGSSGSTLIVAAPTGATVTCSKGDVTKTATEQSGTWTFYGCDPGEWAIFATLGGDEATYLHTINAESQMFTYYITIGFQLYITDFDLSVMGTLGTDYEIVHDDDTSVDPSEYATLKNYKFRLLTSTTKVKPLKDGKIDVFAVGGGGRGHGRGGGGGGGYTETILSYVVVANSEYPVTIGGGGGSTTAFGVTAECGANAKDDAVYGPGADGGSGGGSRSHQASAGSAGDGGSDGSDGGYGANAAGGTGQGTTTREFGEPTGRLYAGGGGGAGFNGATRGIGGQGGGGNGGGSDKNGNNGVSGSPGEANTGGGSGGGHGTSPLGGSGIVVIRNARG